MSDPHRPTPDLTTVPFDLNIPLHDGNTATLRIPRLFRTEEEFDYLHSAVLKTMALYRPGIVRPEQAGEPEVDESAHAPANVEAAPEQTKKPEAE